MPNYRELGLYDLVKEAESCLKGIKESKDPDLKQGYEDQMQLIIQAIKDLLKP